MTTYTRADITVMEVSTTGTGSPLTLGSPSSGFKSLPAGADGKTLRYTLRDGANSETCIGVYTHSGTTITRTTVSSTNSDSAISLSGGALAVFGPHAADFSSGLSTPESLGNTSGSITPEPSTGEIKRLVNHGSITWNAPTETGGYIAFVTNDGSAGAITASGFDDEESANFDTTNTNRFEVVVTNDGNEKIMTVRALQ